MKTNNILLSDAYKYSHYKFYSPNTTKIYSYLESRGGEFDETVFFGLQYILKEYISKPITQEDLDEAKDILPRVFGRDDVFKSENFQYLIDNYNGYFPVTIKAIPEGTVVPVKNVLMTIENTVEDENIVWVTNFLETLLLQIWYPITVATLSREIKKITKTSLLKTTNNFDGLEFMLNDFGKRGVSSMESSAIGGAAHLVNFTGSDNVIASKLIKDYYNSNFCGISIPATEHSICTQETENGELNVFKRVLEEFPNGMVACVSDSYNIIRACEEYWGTILKDKVLERDGVLVIRPDSGDPVQTLLIIFNILFEKFGYTINELGYKVLPNQVRIIQGDGVNFNSIKEILTTLEINNISTCNLVFGMGGKLLQGVNRDTQNFAIKCSYSKINGKDVMIEKSPLEINKLGQEVKSFKKSKKGKLKLVNINGNYKTISSLDDDFNKYKDELVEVFRNGEIIKQYTFEEIRLKANI